MQIPRRRHLLHPAWKPLANALRRELHWEGTELFAREIFDSAFEARVLWNDYCQVYNHERPHSSLGYLPPAVFAAALRSLESS